MANETVSADAMARARLARAGLQAIERLVELAKQDKDLNLAMKACQLLTRGLIPPAQQAAPAPTPVNQHLHAYLPPLFAGAAPPDLLQPMEAVSANDAGRPEASSQGLIPGPGAERNEAGNSAAAPAGPARPDAGAAGRNKPKAKKQRAKAAAADKGKPGD